MLVRSPPSATIGDREFRYRLRPCREASCRATACLLEDPEQIFGKYFPILSPKRNGPSSGVLAEAVISSDAGGAFGIRQPITKLRKQHWFRDGRSSNDPQPVVPPQASPQRVRASGLGTFCSDDPF